MPLLNHRLVKVVSHVFAALFAALACVVAMPVAQAGTAQTIDAMDAIRERLATKLGAVPVAPSAPAGVLKVTVPADAASAASIKRTTAPRPSGTSHWAYEGQHGPAAWARMAPENATCANGNRQSPIDITGGIKVELDAVQFGYQPTEFRVIDNGHTVQVNVAPGNTIEVLGKRYELVQFHFHRPSEERIDGKPFDMVVHLLHKSADGQLAMVAVLLERGSAQPVVQSVWNNLPLEQASEVAAKGSIDPAGLLPSDRRYYTYMGSLTTPPCSEGVLWMVMKAPVPISPEQLDIFARLYPMNARPIQALRGRRIKESN